MEEGQSVLKILVCDDDQADRKLVRAYLQQINDRDRPGLHGYSDAGEIGNGVA